MANHGVGIICLLCINLCTSFVEGSNYEFILDINNQRGQIQSVSIPFGSRVTLVCPNVLKYKVEWIKTSIALPVAYIDYNNGRCTLNNDNYPSIKLGRHICSGGNYSIQFLSIQYADRGRWYCRIKSSRSQFLYIDVTADVDHTQTTMTSVSQSPSCHGQGSISGLAASLGVSLLLLLVAVLVIIRERTQRSRHNAAFDEQPVTAYNAVPGEHVAVTAMSPVYMYSCIVDGGRTTEPASPATGGHSHLNSDTQEYQNMYSVMPEAAIESKSKPACIATCVPGIKDESNEYQHMYSVVEGGASESKSPPVATCVPVIKDECNEYQHMYSVVVRRPSGPRSTPARVPGLKDDAHV